jgi:low temperature requirement protein LtrA
VWGCWNYTTWFTNYFDPSKLPVRLLLVGLMLTSLVMSASLPKAFAGWGLAFGVAYVVLNVGRTVFALIAIGRKQPLTDVFLRPVIWWSATGILWIVGGVVGGGARIACWVAAVAIEYVGTWIGFATPRLGRSRTTDYTISGGHMAERCQLFVLLALGESLLGTGVNFGRLPDTSGTIVAFGAAFLGSVALWWIYFNRGAEAGREQIAKSKDPGRLGVLAYTFAHVPMVAGIIVFAAAADLTVPHSGIKVTVATTALILGGPVLYLLGHAAFKQTLWLHVAWPQLIAVLALVASVAIASVSSRLVLLVVAVVIVAGVALWDTRSSPSV